MKTVGVLALQGAFEKHAKVVEALGAKAVYVRTVEDLEQVEGLILPGGESTTIGKLMKQYGLMDPIKDRICKGMPAFGTCAGMILLSQATDLKKENLLQVMDIEVERNAYGAQVESFEAQIPNTVFETAVEGLFIRAPRISKLGKNVEVLGTYENTPVWVKQNHITACSFHPELTDDLRIHERFLADF